MNPRKIKYRKVERDHYKLYLKKANDFYEAMLHSYKKGNWNSVGLEAIHCAISGADALMVYLKGIRSTSEDHRDAVELIELNISGTEVKKHLSQFRAIINKKNLVEYEERNFTKKEAEDILKKSERFLNWIKNQLR